MEASDIIEDDTNPRLYAEATLLKDEQVIPVQPRYSKVNAKGDWQKVFLITLTLPCTIRTSVRTSLKLKM